MRYKIPIIASLVTSLSAPLVIPKYSDADILINHRPMTFYWEFEDRISEHFASDFEDPLGRRFWEGYADEHPEDSGLVYSMFEAQVYERLRKQPRFQKMELEGNVVYLPAQKGIWGDLCDFLEAINGRKLDLSEGTQDREIFDRYWVRTCEMNSGRWDDLNRIPEGEVLHLPAYIEETKEPELKSERMQHSEGVNIANGLIIVR